MGSSASRAAATAPPPPAYAPPPPAFDAAAPPKPHEEAGKPAAAEEKVDYMNLPCPVPYEEVQRESFMSLKPEVFEGLRLDYAKMLNQSFGLTHSISMGAIEIPQQGNDVIKIPSGTYEFGANFLDPKLMLIGRLSPDGRVNARVKADLTENLALKINAQMTSEPGYSQGMCSFDYKGKDYRSQFQIGNNEFYGANYIQSVTKNLSLGTEAFWVGQQRKSGVGLVARYDTKNFVATGQIATTGLVALSYVQKVSEKVSLASDFMYNQMSKDVSASFGYDYMLRQCRLRGKVDTNGVVSALLEERLAPGLTFLLSAEIDHWKKDYKFGYGMSIGE